MTNKKIVLAHGVFDLLHAGHLAYFRSAKKYGDYLIVSVTSDRFVNKGPGRPYFTAQVRAEMLRSLSMVDEVLINDSPSAVPMIDRVKPQFYVKGPDYKDLTKDVTGEIYNEQRATEEHGGKLVFTDDETFSSSHLINKAFQVWTDDQVRVINEVKRLGGMSAVYDAVERLSKLRVQVLGETILDVYRFCQPENISSKSPSISARFQYEEVYNGGVWAIENHLKSFCKDVEILSPNDFPRIRKIRYIAHDKAQRIFEVTEVPSDSYCYDTIELCKKINLERDVTIVADFGHRLLEGRVLDKISEIKGFVGLNVQTNSSNYGFNLFKKHKRFDFLCLDTREARLSEHDRTSSPLNIARKISSKHPDQMIALTVGAGGAYLLNDDEYFSPAFSGSVVDATGAGDAFFCLGACLLKAKVHSLLVLFLSNVFAGLKTQIIGNKSSVSQSSLLKSCDSILK